MKCPIDDAELVMSDRQGIEIDYCPKCRGVWLDRGELDKIIDRSVEGQQASQPVREKRYQDDSRYRDDKHQYDRPYKKKKSFLGDIFDF